MSQTVRIAGIDVGKEQLVIACPALGIGMGVANDRDGHEAIVAWLGEHQIAVAAVEASGGYERAVMARLGAVGLVVRHLNPLRVRRFAEARGRLAKNDRADAETIARYAETFVDEHTAPPPDAQRDALREHLLVRTNTLHAITLATNQLEHLRDKSLRAILAARRTSLQLTLKRLDARIAALVIATPNLAAAAARLRSVPGVGPVLAHTLIALLPELGRLTRRQVASLAGVAPFDYDSGKHRGLRHIAAGRAAVRQVLYMAALVAKRCNPAIRTFAERLKGKPPKTIIAAYMRKLLVILNAIARDAAVWKPA